MNKLILSIHPTKKHPQYETVNLLEANEKSSIALLRDKLHDVDLVGKLVLCLDSELSKLFKEDYSFNDHGIYYDVYFNSNFDLNTFNLEQKTKKLQTKLKKKYTEDSEQELKRLEKELIDRQSTLAFVLIPLEKETAKRDYQRFVEFESFVDPILKYHKEPLATDYYDTYVLDIETTGLEFDKYDITLIGLKGVYTDSYSIICNPSRKDILKLFEYLEGTTIVGHNLLFDLSWLMYKAGLSYAPNINTVDTMLLAHVAGERRLSLKHLSMMLGNFKGRRNTMTADDSYLLEDLLATELLYTTYKSSLDTFAGKLVCNAVKAFAETKVKGLKLNEQRLFAIRDSYSSYDVPKYNFNVDSNRELSEYLKSSGVALTAKTERGDYKVDRPTLENFKDNPVVAEYLDYQAEVGIYQKFIKPYCELQDFTIRPDIRLSGTETGRLSCSNPNVQQVPNRSLFKDIFRSRFGDNGWVATIDLDQAELRIAALLSGDEIYSRALLSNDFHKLVASKTFEKEEKAVTKQERFTAKAVNFGGVLYGGSAKGIAERIKVETELVAKVQNWYAKEFVKLTQWIESEKETAVHTNEVKTLFGRTRKLEGLRWDQKRRIGVNTAVQSVASDVMLYIVTRLSSLIRQNKLQSQIMFPVHDELLLDIHKEEFDQVINLLKQAFKDVLRTPIGQLDLAKTLPISGTLEYGVSWLYLKNEKYPPVGSVKISSLGD